jgi:chemotaxis protein methyltransferase CheR
MESRVFHAFRELIYAESGISLGEQKTALVSARIGKRMKALGMESWEEYLEHAREGGPSGEMLHLLDAISTNVTHFFREKHHFEFLSARVREWVGAGARKLRIWSAGCSSGEEPYTLGMVLAEALRGSALDTRILATDLSTRILRACLEARYHDKSIAEVPSELRERYLDREGDGLAYRVKPSIRSMVTFQRLNLSRPPFPMNGPMDAIFCRNVMIYFDDAVRRRLLADFHRLLKPGGFLFVGHSENLTGYLSNLKSVAPSVYVKEAA